MPLKIPQDELNKFEDRANHRAYFSMIPRIVWSYSRSPYDYILWAVVVISPEKHRLVVSNATIDNFAREVPSNDSQSNELEAVYQGHVKTSICSNVRALDHINPNHRHISTRRHTMTTMIPQPTSPEYHAACTLYMAAKGVEEIPTIDELISWMHKRGGYDYIARMRNTLDLIWDVLEEIGAVAVEENVPVSGFTILRLRVLTQRCPRRSRGKQKKATV